MTVEDLDSSLCTHLVYAYQGIDSDSTIKLADEWLMIDLKDLDKFQKRKGKGQALTAIGGYSLSGLFPQVVSTDSDRKTFTKSIISFLQKFNFDGVMLDWTPTESLFDDYVKLLANIHSEFDGKYTLGITLTAALPPGFDASKVDPYVDIISLQTFDLHGPWETHGPVGFEDPFSWQYQSLLNWVDAGATQEKLVMTIPMFAHTWTLEDPDKTDPGAAATGPGKAGPWSQLEGYLWYKELCTAVKEDPSSWTVRRDDEEKAVYAIHGRTWVTYEDVKTCEAKTNKVTTEGFGGVAVQALGYDDFKGLCGDKYPLLNAINKGLNRDPTPHTHRPTFSTTEATPDPTKICTKEGVFADPYDCHVYHICTEDFPGVFTDEKKTCDKGLAFDEKVGKCIDESEVPTCR